VTPPTLSGPAAGAAVLSGAQFSWSRVTGASYYRFCITRPPAPCPDATVNIAQTLTLVASDPPLNPDERPGVVPDIARFAGSSVQWSVAACYSQGQCVYAPPRAVRVAHHTSPHPVFPTDGARLGATSEFIWAGAPGAQRYQLCIHRGPRPCPSQAADGPDTLIVTVPGGTTSVTAQLGRFLGDDITWHVRPCPSADACNLSDLPRRARVNTPPPNLHTPASGGVTRSYAQFQWSVVSWANYYVVCVTTHDIACPDPTAHSENQLSGQRGTILGSLEGDGYSAPSTASTSQTLVYGLPASLSRDRLAVDMAPLEGNYRWTVAACWVDYSVPGQSRITGCRYQTNYRPIRVQPLWDFAASVTRIDVHDDCDNVSVGDWNMAVTVETPTRDNRGSWQPEGYSRDVTTGDVLEVGFGASLLNLVDGETVTVGVFGVDCDSNGIWTLLSIMGGVQGVTRSMLNWATQCSGEEFLDPTGATDFLGAVSREIALSSHRAAGRIEQTLMLPAGPGECGAGPAYTVTVRIEAERK
jgi:hypothetical protein